VTATTKVKGDSHQIWIIHINKVKCNSHQIWMTQTTQVTVKRL